MEFQRYLLVFFGEKNETWSSFTARVTGQITPRLAAFHPESLRVSMTVSPPPFSLFPFSHKKMALFTWEGEKPPANGLPPHLVYRSVHSEPRSPEPVLRLTKSDRSEKTAESDRTLTPGVCMVTFFNRKKGLDTDTFIERWFDHHTPYSLEHFPLAGYVRNMACPESTDNNMETGPSFEGIVEEFFETKEDLLRPWRFFGSFLKMPVRIIELLTDIRSFIDLSTLETYYCHFAAII